MKLLMISTDERMFDADSAVRARQLLLASQLSELHIIVFTTKFFPVKKIASNCWLYATGSVSRLLCPFDAIRIGSHLIKERGVSEITCQDPFLTGLAGFWLKRRHHLVLELQLHTDIGSPCFTNSFANWVRYQLARYFLPRATTIRVVSQKIKDYLVRNLGISETKITVRPIVVDTARIKQAPITINLRQKYPQFSKIVLMASRLEREKNIELALRAWPLVLQQIPKAGLVIVGYGSEENNLKKLTKKLGIRGQVIFEPWLESSALFSYYKTADLFLLTSFYEGYGLTLVEAHAAGCRIISTDVGIARELGADIVLHDSANLANAVIAKI